MSKIGENGIIYPESFDETMTLLKNIKQGQTIHLFVTGRNSKKSSEDSKILLSAKDLQARYKFAISSARAPNTSDNSGIYQFYARKL